MKIVLILLVLCTVAFSETFYVDNKSPNPGDGSGSLVDPFKSIQLAATIVDQGDTISVRGDRENEENQVYIETIPLIRQGGTGTNTIVIETFNEENVEIQPFSSTVLNLNRSGYVIDGFVFNGAGTNGDLIKVESNNNVIRNCTIKNGSRDGIDISSGNNNRIENCVIYDFIWFDGNSRQDAHGIVISDAINTVITNCEIYNCTGDGIQIHEGNSDGTYIGDNDLYTLIGDSSENAIDIKTSSNVTLVRNKMHGFRRTNGPGSDGAALVVHHRVVNLVVFGNEIYNSNGGMRITQGDGIPDGIRLERNVIYDIIDEGNFSTDGYGIQFDDIINVEMYNNTLTNIEGPLFWIESVTNLDMRNNIFHDGKSFHGSQNDISGENIFSYNGWFNCEEIISGENDLIGTEPGFISIFLGDFQLRDDSPCLNRGDPSFGDDFPGGRIDLGAFEFIWDTLLPPEIDKIYK